MLPRWSIFLPFLALPFLFGLGQSVNATVWLTKYKEFPQCGTACAMEIVPMSTCKTLTNYTCLCEDQPIRVAMTECTSQKCTGMEIFTLAKLDAEGCQAPLRSRRSLLLGLIPIQIIVLTSFFLRFYSRKVMVGKYDRDDYTMFSVLCFYFLYVIIGNLAYFRGFGVDIWTVEAHQVDLALMLFWFSNTVYLIIMEVTKISILMFYLRVFPHENFQLATFITIGWVATCTLIFINLQIFQCIPIPFNWLGWRGDFGAHRCIDINRFAYAAGTTMIAQDLIILVLPLPWLVSLNTTPRNKIGIIIMFSMGLFILVTSCIRLRYLVAYARTVNPTWDYTDQLVWSSLEVAVSILVVNVPAVRVLFVKKISPAVRSVLTMRHNTKKAGSMYYNAKNNKSLVSVVRPGQKVGGGGASIGTQYGSNSSESKASRDGTTVSVTISDDAPLKLGDKLKGDVQTVICVGMPTESTDDLRRPSTTSSRHARGQSRASEILVETTTMRIVATGDLSEMHQACPACPSSPLGQRSASASAAPGRNYSLSRPQERRGLSFARLDV